MQFKTWNDLFDFVPKKNQIFFFVCFFVLFDGTGFTFHISLDTRCYSILNFTLIIILFFAHSFSLKGFFNESKA